MLKAQTHKSLSFLLFLATIPQVNIADISPASWVQIHGFLYIYLYENINKY